MNKQELTNSAIRTSKTFLNVLPIILGMLLLTSGIVNMAPETAIMGYLGKHEFLDVLIGTLVGSVAAGHPLASYILGGELLEGGVSLLAVTALIVSWVTVGVVQLPAEALMLGRRFAIYRNLLCFLSAIGVSFLTIYTLQLFV
jgi:uncharacterized membrane protein YraQ (UPF0718 family)